MLCQRLYHTPVTQISGRLLDHSNFTTHGRWLACDGAFLWWTWRFSAATCLLMYRNSIHGGFEQRRKGLESAMTGDTQV